jgi:ABC-type transport system substrate-binding protein
MARDIKELVRVDDFTVRIVLNHRNPRWFFTFLTVRFTEGLFILPKHIYAATDPNDLAGFTAMKPGPAGPVGTGAFKITSMTPERIILDRRDDWWGLKTGFHPPAAMKPARVRRAQSGTLSLAVDTPPSTHVSVEKPARAIRRRSPPSPATSRPTVSTGGRPRCSSTGGTVPGHADRRAISL